jgi:hypothetical protein
LRRLPSDELVLAGHPHSQFWALPAKYHAAQLIAKTLGFCIVSCGTEALRQFEKLLLLPLFGLDAVLDSLCQHPIGAPMAFPPCSRLGRDIHWQAHPLPHSFFNASHSTIMHQQWCVTHPRRFAVRA